MHKCANSIYL